MVGHGEIEGLISLSLVCSVDHKSCHWVNMWLLMATFKSWKVESIGVDFVRVLGGDGFFGVSLYHLLFNIKMDIFHK